MRKPNSYMPKSNMLQPLLLSALLAAGLAGAQAADKAPNVASTAPATAVKPVPVPLLWKVSDADNSVYLLGSFHLLKPDDYPLAPEIEAAFLDAERVVFELDPKAMQSPELAAKFQQAAGYADGRTLSRVLPVATREKLEKLLTASGGSIAQMEAVEPWAVNVGLAIGIMQAMGFRPEQGMDKHFMDRAAQAGKPTSGLESIDAQIAALDGAPHAEQIAGLEEFLANPQQAITELQSMHSWWRSGDVGQLDGKLRAEMAQKTPVSYRLVNTDRNDAWVPQLRQLLSESQSGDSLVVVGALHLLGSDGVVEKLRGKGYTVERVCTACAQAAK